VNRGRGGSGFVTINPGDAGLASEGGHLHSTTLEEGDMLRGSLVLLAGIVAVAGQARAGENEDDVCSNGTIRGEYTFTVHGKTLNPPDRKVTGLQDAIGIIKFDGVGKFIQEDYVLINGVQPLPKGSPAGFQHESGTYKVNPDCTGMIHLVIIPPGNVTRDLALVVSKDGRKIHSIVTKAVTFGPDLIEVYTDCEKSLP
jgi:hypothetical protein